MIQVKKSPMYKEDIEAAKIPHGEIGHFCHGGCAGYAGGGVVDNQPAAEEQDPSVIPEDIKEFVKKAHQDRQESRPDEGWRIKGAQKPEPVAPYKKDEEETTSENAMIPHFDEGTPGTVGDDPEAAAQEAMGAEALIPSRGTPPGPEPINLADIPAPVQPMAQPADNTPAEPGPGPVAPIQAPAAASTAAAPMADEDYMARANKLLGLNPGQQAGLMKLLGKNAQNSQIGAGIAGIGDAIASGGTLGKVNPGNLAKSEEIAQNATKQGLEGMETIRGGQEKAFEMAQKLQAQDPNSGLSKYAQKAYGSIGRKLGLDLSHASASLIADVAGKGVEELNTEYQGQLKQMGLQLQKSQLEATIANQKAEREQAREGNVQGAAKALADKGMWKSLVDMIPGTAGHAANKALLQQATAKNYAPDVTAYAQKHGITLDQAQAIKDKRTGGQ